jgi:hypothetical protein
MSTSTASHNDRKKQGAMPEAKRELIISLRAWGVDPTRSPEHRTFENHALRTLASLFDREPVAKRSESSILPKNIEDAVEKVLKAEVHGKDPHRCGFPTDSIKGMEYAPYIVRPDRFCPPKLFVTLKSQFKGFTKSQLDPLQRFSPRNCTKKEFFVEQWVVAKDAHVQGHVFEAIVASYAYHNMPCYSCKRRRSLRWNGGPTAPWTDMECSSCESSYEIKSKKNMEVIERAQKINLDGGSYSGFLRLHQQSRKNGWKHFLVTVSREPSLSPHKCWAVQIAEIDGLLPRLKPMSFLNDRELQFASEIVTKSALAPWFNIPYQSVEYRDVVDKVLEEMFPGVLAELVAEDDLPDEGTTEETVTESNGNDVAALRDALANMSTSDCWDLPSRFC